MLFSSLPFLFYFLPCALGLYFLAPRRLKNAALLLSSLVFFAWGEPRFVLFMAAAILLFSKYGYKKTTVEEIAGALQMTKGSIYRYFINKEDLYHQVVSQLLNEWRSFVEKSRV